MLVQVVFMEGNGLLNEYNDTNKPIQLYAVSKKTKVNVRSL